MVDGLEMARDHGREGRGIMGALHVFLAHDDRIEPRNLRVAGIEDDDVGPRVGQDLLDRRVPDGVAGKVERLLAFGREQHAADLAEHFPGGGHGRVRSVLAGGAGQADVLEAGFVGQVADVREALAAEQFGVRLVPREERQVLGHESDRSLVPVIGMAMSDDDCIDIENLAHRRGEFDPRIADVAVHRALEARIGIFRREIGIDEEALAAVIDAQRGVPDLSDLHFTSPC
ncbi:hypothetical protein APA386B_2P11 (plasmid) [Acetobacter pasteurianus 386B]|nr:hypothetical protein APA386B_2P11 [Acetobacter pasteurianus 386B]